MKAVTEMKNHKSNEFYVKKCRGYFLVMDGYDKSMASMEATREMAEEVAMELNNMRNNRLNIK